MNAAGWIVLGSIGVFCVGMFALILINIARGGK